MCWNQLCGAATMVVWQEPRACFGPFHKASEPDTSWIGPVPPVLRGHRPLSPVINHRAALSTPSAVNGSTSCARPARLRSRLREHQLQAGWRDDRNLMSRWPGPGRRDAGGAEEQVSSPCCPLLAVTLKGRAVVIKRMSPPHPGVPQGTQETVHKEQER